MPRIHVNRSNAFATIFSDVSELSVWNNCMPPTRRNGIMMMPTTIIPTPPIHCIIERQTKIACGVSSRPDITVAPVVVNAETASKYASATDRPSSTSGIAPNTGKSVQASAVTRKPCRRVRENSP